MSQAGLLDIEGSHPQIPTQFDTDSGFAIPLANVLELLGNTVANAAFSKPLEVTASGNTVEFNIQVGAAITGAPADKNDAGLVSFDDTAFSVDSNGYVTLIGGGPGIDSIGVDAATAPGTNPVVPSGGGVITVTGAQVAAGTTTNVIRTNSVAANQFTIEIQRSSDQATSTVGANGVCHFRSSQFLVDTDGFVQLVGGGAAIESVAVQTGTSPILPSAGLITINGAVVAAGTNPVRSNGTGANTLAMEVQISQALAATDATKIGLSNFDSASFAVDANGFVTAAGTGLGQTITGDSGGALSPTAGNWNILGQQAGAIPVMDTIGSGSTLSIEDRTSPSVFVVDAQTTAGLRGTYSTIQSAITAASAGDTVIIRPGQYTEDITLKNGVNLSGFSNFGGSGGRTKIIGKMIDNGGGVNCTLTSLALQTNSDFCISLTGSGVVVLANCRCDGTNNTIFSCTNTSTIGCFNTSLNLTTTGVAIFTGANSGSFQFNRVSGDNSGSSTAASSTPGSVSISNSTFPFPMATTGAGTVNIFNSFIDNSPINTTSLSTAGTGTSSISNSETRSGSASAISIGTGTTVNLYKSTVNSTNTNPVTGAGTYKSDATTYSNTGVLPNTTTRTFAVMGERSAWTPVLDFSGGTTGITYSAQSGLYTRVGNVITFTLSFVLTNKGSSTGTAQITGLPYAPANITIYPVSANALTFVGSLNARMAGASATIFIDAFATTGARASLTDTAFANTTFVQVSGSYLV